MTPAVLFTLLVPVSVATALGLALLSGRIPQPARPWITRVFALVVYGWLVASMSLKAAEYGHQADWLLTGLMAAAALIFAVMGCRIIVAGSFGAKAAK